MQCNPKRDILGRMLTENVSYFYDFSIDNRKDVRYNTNIHTEYMFGIFVWNICIARIIYNIIKYGGVFYARDEYQNNCTDL